MKIYDLKIVNQKVTKHRVGENSTFNSTLSKQYFFEGNFIFNTGSKVNMMLVEPREEFESILTLNPTYKDIEKAQEIALLDYNNCKKLISDPMFRYARAKNEFGGYCNIYGKDENSPTGVKLIGACSSYKLADFVMTELGIASGTLSPTEDLRTCK